MSDDVKDLVSRTTDLKKLVEELNKKAAVAAADESRLKKEVSAALLELKNEFDCASYDEAVEKRAALTEELKEALDELEEQINEIRGI